MGPVVDAILLGVVGLTVAADNSLPTITLDVDALDGWLRVAVSITVIITFLAWWRGKADKKSTEEREATEARILAALEERTKPIQPKYRNDGESLADIANEVKRIGQAQAEHAIVLTSVHKNVAEASMEIALHRAAVAEQFTKMRDERAAILAAAAAQTEEWRVALSQQGLVVPDEPNEPI